ncbi:hypothetical protein [Clostridium sp. BJN0013]|uniref:hypothetical protein n=1 Tax=Clostridium sp. BJN0013 TaxID=3236840 RepID=UPI0034C64E66
MRVYVKSGKVRFIIPIPFIFLKLGISIFSSSFVRTHIPQKDRKYFDMIDFREFSKCLGILKQYKGLRIVEVRAKDGIEVIITL